MQMQHKPRSQKSWILIGVLAFLVQGGWTLWANMSHGWRIALPSALLQGLLSGGSASMMTVQMEAIHRQIASAVLRPVLCVSVPSASMAGVLYVLHRLIGTPEIATTMLLPMVAIFAYGVMYTIKLTLQQRPKDA